MVGGTRVRVLDAALRLFNERGTAAVSTNHIAEEAGVSPGNLYYHYRNKEEIVRELWGRLDVAWEGAYALPSGRDPVLGDVRAMMEETFVVLWEYRFFYREMVALLRRDPELRGRYAVARERGLAGTEALLRSFVEARVISAPEDPATVPGLAKVLLLVAEFWLPFEEAGGEASGPEWRREGVEALMRVLEPRLVSRGSPVGGRPPGEKKQKEESREETEPWDR